MNREIKFRAYAPNKGWIQGFNLISCHNYYTKGLEPKLSRYDSEWNIKDIHLMQYTGLKDKNGVEIYEGDVIRIDGTIEYVQCTPKPKKDEYVGVFVVKHESWSHGYEFTWYNISGYECSTHIMGSADDNGIMANVEIIGNIYENPELIP